jgi:Spy/CpxP family protein refolding chaperone
MHRQPAQITRPRLCLAAVVLAALAFAAPRAFAQHGGGPPPGGPPGGGQPGGFPGGNPNMGPPPGSPNGANATTSTLRGGLQLGPPGRWWDDHDFAKSLGLDRDQQHRMDDIFKTSKGDLIKLFKALQHEEDQLERISRSRNLDEVQIDQQIDRVVQARGELEKANAHMLLQIRKEMTPEQLARLDEHRPPLSSSEN